MRDGGPHERGSRGASATRRLAYHELAVDEDLAADGGAAFEELYRRHQPIVYRYCLGFLGAPEAASDAAQSTWMRALTALSAPGTVVRNVRPWLCAIARNECLDLLRADGSEQLLDVSTLQLPAATTPEDEYEKREDYERLLAELRRLSWRQQAAIVLREVCGLSSDELGDILQTTRERASWLVADARRTLTQRRSERRPRRSARAPAAASCQPVDPCGEVVNQCGAH